VTHPAWTAQALDESGRAVASPLLAAFSDVPAASHVLEGRDDRVAFAACWSPRTTVATGVPFAGSPAVLINEIDLVH
jgi:hypothetical protein